MTPTQDEATSDSGALGEKKIKEEGTVCGNYMILYVIICNYIICCLLTDCSFWVSCLANKSAS